MSDLSLSLPFSLPLSSFDRFLPSFSSPSSRPHSYRGILKWEPYPAGPLCSFHLPAATVIYARYRVSVSALLIANHLLYRLIFFFYSYYCPQILLSPPPCPASPSLPSVWGASPSPTPASSLVSASTQNVAPISAPRRGRREKAFET